MVLRYHKSNCFKVEGVLLLNIRPFFFFDWIVSLYSSFWKEVKFHCRFNKSFVSCVLLFNAHVIATLNCNSWCVFLLIALIAKIVVIIVYRYFKGDWEFVSNYIQALFFLLRWLCFLINNEVMEMRSVHHLFNQGIELASHIMRTNAPLPNNNPNTPVLPLFDQEKLEELSCQRLHQFSLETLQDPVYNGGMDNLSLSQGNLGSRVLRFHNDFQRPFFRLPTIKVLRCFVEGNLVSTRFHRDPIRNGIISELAWFHSFRGNMPVLDKSLLFDSEITSLKTTKTQTVTIGTFGNFPSKASLCFSREPGCLEVDGVLTPYISSIELVVGHCPADRFTQLHYLQVDHAFLAENISLSWVPRKGGSFGIKACVKLGAIANSSIDLLD